MKQKAGHAEHHPTHNLEHDKPGYHQTGFGTHRLNVGNHRLEYTHKPCKNKACKSHGSKHPNCKCYAEGGDVDHFCDKDREHDSDCEYYAKGGSVKSTAMKSFNLSKFKKQKEDSKTVTMMHENGHVIKIMKSGLSHMQKKQLEKLPAHYDEGGDVNKGPELEEAPNDAGASDATPAAIGQMAMADTNARLDKGINGPGLDTSNQGPLTASISTTPGPNDQRTDGQPQMGPPPPPSPGGIVPLDKLNLQDVYSGGMNALKAQEAAEAGLAQYNVKNEQDRQTELQDAQRHAAYAYMNINRNINDTLQDIKNTHIDPNHYLENQSVPSKIASAIGLLAGGFSKNGVNPAQQWLSQQIDRDIAAQKNDLENKKTVYSGYLDQYKNATVADQLARATQLGVYSSKVAEAAAKAGTPLAQAKLQTLSTDLQSRMIPLQQNAHLINQFDQFNGGSGTQPGAGKGNEAQFTTTLNAAQHVNPTIYADQQSKYVPGVGVAPQAVPGEIKSRLINLASVTPLVDKAIAMQENYGHLGAALNTKLGDNPFNSMAQADDLTRQLVPLLGQVTDVSGGKSQIYNNYAKQVGQLGTMNLGGTLQTLKDLKAQVDSDTNSAISSAKIKTFSDYKRPSGLSEQDQQKLNIFMSKNPQYKNDQGAAVQKLRVNGIINGG